MPLPASPRPIVPFRDPGVTRSGAAGAVALPRGVGLGPAPGETVRVVGPSGTGKTALFTAVGGRPEDCRVPAGEYEPPDRSAGSWTGCAGTGERGADVESAPGGSGR